MTEKFRLHLLQSGLSQNTVQSYMWTVTHFIRRYGAFTHLHTYANTGKYTFATI